MYNKYVHVCYGLVDIAFHSQHLYVKYVLVFMCWIVCQSLCQPVMVLSCSYFGLNSRIQLFTENVMKYLRLLSCCKYKQKLCDFLLFFYCPFFSFKICLYNFQYIFLFVWFVNIFSHMDSLTPFFKVIVLSRLRIKFSNKKICKVNFHYL